MSPSRSCHAGASFPTASAGEEARAGDALLDALGTGEAGGEPAPESVAAVVVTYRRPRLASEVVRRLLRHEGVAAGRIVLVVNGEGGLDDPELERRIQLVRLAENNGPAAGFREGMRVASGLPGVEWFYLCEDDVALFDLPAPRLARLVGDAEALEKPGSPVGAVVAYGRDLHRRSGHTTVHEVDGPTGYDRVDAASWGASLVSRRVLAAGVEPSDDYFFGYEDFDYCYQLRRAGLQVLLDNTSASRVASQMSLPGRDQAFEGERPLDADEPWRAFYVARNYFLLARRHGSWSWVLAHLGYSLRRLQLASSPAERSAILHGLLAGALGRRGKDVRYQRQVGELVPGSGAPGAETGERVGGSGRQRHGRQRRILHVLPCDMARGAQVFVRDLCGRLDGQPDEHLVLMLFAAPTAVLPGALSLAVPMGALRRAGFDPRVAQRLAGALRRLSPDLVVAHGGEPLKYLAVLRSARLSSRRLPLVYLAIGTVSGKAARGLSRLLYRSLFASADLVVGVSQETLDEAVGRFGVASQRTALVPNGRDGDRYRSEQRCHDGPVRLLFVGHLTHTKRPQLFVTMIERLRATGRDVRGFLAGNGPLEAELRAAAAASAPVEVLGRRDDVPELLASADLFVFCSVPESEGMPGVLLEAALAGLPIVTTDVPGARDVVLDGESGLVVAPHDAEGMLRALERLVDDPALRAAMGEVARRSAVERFDLAIVAERWQCLLDELAERGGQRAP